ncbi:response regulator [Henriciella sp.]|uniref:response regulator n=1 Tax=Henriciella sp. TaxID=1968823 RepID=UPI002637220E|nr:response regulator [Henriciella sp.]
MSQARILVVDDDRMLRTLVVYKLSDKGFTVEEAANGEEALQHVSENTPDLIILDGMMPGMDGSETLRHLKSDPATSSIPVFMLTARRSEEDIERALRLGANDYLAKPFNPDDLVLRIQRFISERTGESSTQKRA